jgi:hypothetical protein
MALPKFDIHICNDIISNLVDEIATNFNLDRGLLSGYTNQFKAQHLGGLLPTDDESLPSIENDDLIKLMYLLCNELDVKVGLAGDITQYFTMRASQEFKKTTGHDVDFDNEAEKYNPSIPEKFSSNDCMDEFMQSIRDNNTEMVDDLILNIDISECRTVEGDTPLHLAVVAGNSDLIQRLLKGGNCNYVDVKNYKGKSPLNYACGLNREDIIEMLLIVGANPFIKSDSGDYIASRTCAVARQRYTEAMSNVPSIKLQYHMIKWRSKTFDYHQTYNHSPYKWISFTPNKLFLTGNSNMGFELNTSAIILSKTIEQYFKDPKTYKHINCAVCFRFTSQLEEKKLMQCSKCKSVKFCSVHCQKECWTIHKKHCRKPKV